ncbi:MAG: hypothetical protein L6Q99_06905 [Planctomycetes bacterium]|nr:hypothetical protein [Planctomycetota bacterium]
MATNATLPADTCIVAESARAGRRRELATRAVAADGTWSATALPADEVDEFVFRLVGSGLAPIEKSIVRPAPGASYTLDFECGVGFEAWVRAVRPSGEPVATATLYARWFDGSRFVELERTSDDSGTATLPIPKDVSVHFGARVAGFAAAEIGPFTFSEPASRTLTIELAPAGRIVGRCTHGATPVRDFEVVYWQGRPESRRSLRINDSIDGAFLIDDAPLGEVLLFAHSTTSPAGDTKSVQVTREQDAAVGLELGNGRRGHGFVIDATSGEPVTEATVQRITNLPDGTPLLRGAPEPVGTDGAFVVDGLPPQSTAVWIAASGYAPRVATTPADARVVADFGVIPLAHAQDLELRLIADAGFDFTQAGAQSADSPLLPLRRFEADGTLVYRNVPPRAVSVRIDTPSATEIFELRLVPGRLWRFELPFSGQRTCVVRTRWSDESARPQFVEATFRRTSGLTSRYAAVDSEGIARVDGIEGSELNLTAFAGEWRQLGSRSYRVPESGVGDVELACSNDALRVLVVDARGAAVVGARVSFLNDASSLGWAYVYYTDGSGECSLPGSTAEKLRIYAEARDHGLAGPIVVDPSVTRDAPVRITLSGLERLRVRLDDRGVACGGVDVRFVAEDGRLVTEATTDANGRVASQPVGEGRYSLDVEAPGYWPIHHALPAPRTTVETVVPLRRLGGIRFVVLAANGAVVPDSVIELQSREFEATVEQWISAGKLLAPQQGLRSDSNGAFVIDGLPNGDYVWRVTAPDGAQASGVTLVPPRARGEQTVLFAK